MTQPDAIRISKKKKKTGQYTKRKNKLKIKTKAYEDDLNT